LVSIVFLVSVFTGQPSLTVTTTNPVNNTVDVPQTSNIDIVFSRNLTQSDQQKISVVFSPQIDTTSEFSGNQLVLAPKTSLEKGILYNVVINSSGKAIYSFSFETIIFTPEQIREEGAAQTVNDKIYGDAFTKFIQGSPWYLSIPVEKDDYEIVYNFDKKSFRIQLKVAIPSDQLNGVIQNALGDLKAIGVPAPISYYVLDINGNQL